jgi:hypothetical protein
MKKILTKLMALSSIGLLMLSACKKSGELATSDGGKAGALTASVTSLPLSKAMVSDTTTVVTFSFKQPTYNFAASVTNTLQIDIPSDNWGSKLVSFTMTAKTFSQGFSTPTFNALLLKLGIPAGTPSTVSIRVMSSLSSYVAPTYTNVLSLNVTDFNLTSWVYVPGAYEGWGNPGAQEDSLISPTGNGVYSGIINFSTGNNQFLIVPVKGSWTNKWATSAAGVNPTGTAVTYPTVYNGPNNFYAPVAAGYYLITFDSNANTISITPSDYYSLTGSAALGWGNDTPMKFLNDGSNNWVATTVPMTAAEYKFRLDDAWNTSWGPGAAANSAVTSGATGDGNFQITTAGNYNFTLTQPPTALGGTPLGTTTYTAVKQ